MPALAGIAARTGRPVQWPAEIEFVIKVRTAKGT